MGEMVHGQIFTNSTSPAGYIRGNVGYLPKDYRIYTVRTYRYIYPFCRHFKFKDKELPYPVYNRGMDPCEWKRDRELIKTRVKNLLDKI